MSDSNQMTGGWSPFTTDFSELTQDAFDTATKGLLGVGYQPVAVAQQVVNGMNYQFFCNAKTVVPDAPNRAVMMHIYRPTDGDASIEGIERLN